MTDKEKLLALLGEWGVPGRCEDQPPDPGTATVECVIVGEGRNEKVTGFAGFFTAFEFDADGKFVQMGAWE